jgi:chromosome segregation ATPase
LTQAETQASQPETEESRLQAKVDELTEESTNQITKKHDLEKELKQAREPLKMRERQRKQLDDEIGKAEKELKRAKQRLDQRREQIVAQAGSAQSEEARRTIELREAEEKLQKATEDEKVLRQETTDTLNLYDEIGPYVQEAKQKVAHAQKQHAAIKNKIHSLQNSSGSNSLAVFGQKCGALKQEVCSIVGILEPSSHSDTYYD